MYIYILVLFCILAHSKMFFLFELIPFADHFHLPVLQLGPDVPHSWGLTRGHLPATLERWEELAAPKHF